MELVLKVDAHTRVSAGLEEDGQLTLKVFAQAEYMPGRTTTAEIPLDQLDPAKADAVKAALAAVLEDAADKLGGALNKAIVKSTEISAAHGEN